MKKLTWQESKDREEGNAGASMITIANPGALAVGGESDAGSALVGKVGVDHSVLKLSGKLPRRARDLGWRRQRLADRAIKFREEVGWHALLRHMFVWVSQRRGWNEIAQIPEPAVPMECKVCKEWNPRTSAYIGRGGGLLPTRERTLAGVPRPLSCWGCAE